MLGMERGLYISDDGSHGSSSSDVITLLKGDFDLNTIDFVEGKFLEPIRHRFGNQARTKAWHDAALPWGSGAGKEKRGTTSIEGKLPFFGRVLTCTMAGQKFTSNSSRCSMFRSSSQW